MRILITGSNGYAASNIIACLETNHQLVLTSRSKTTGIHNLPVIPLDLTDTSAVTALLNQIRPEIIIHTAAISSIDYAETHKQETHALNVGAVATLCRYCGAHSTWLIHFSTDALFSGKNAPYTEESIPHPINYYGTSKLEAEQIIQSNHDFPYTICRPSVIYGWKKPHHRGNLFYDFFTRLSAGETIFASEIHCGNPTYIDDIGRCVEQIINKKIYGIIHTVGPTTLSKFEFASELATIFDLNLELIEPLKHHPGKAPRPANLALKYEKTIEKLGIQLDSPKRALTDLYRMRFEE